MKPPKLRNTSAFTLVELLIVIAIATILATLSLTTLQGLLKDQKITSSVRLVRQYFEVARTRAMATGRPVAIFLERVSPNGDGAGNAVPANYSVTRMSIGEVFPPYTGEDVTAVATLWDVPFPVNSRMVDRNNDGIFEGDDRPDQARILLSSAVSGFGTTGKDGMIAPGDSIQFVGDNQRFEIEEIDLIAGASPPQVGITFFNPPASYDGVMGAKPYASRHRTFERSYAGKEPALQANGTVTGSMYANATTTTAGVGFRVYRKPSKSLVGTITMPRGTCIDLSVSGIGENLCGVDPDATLSPSFYPFRLARDADLVSTIPPPPVDPFTLSCSEANPPVTPGTLKRSSYSRIAILFNPEGRAQGMYRDDRMVQIPSGVGPETVIGYRPFPLSTKLHLMIGRTEQVIPDAPVSRPGAGDRGDALGNLMDTGNTWLSINPFTGLMETSPVAAVSDAAAATAVAAYGSGDRTAISTALRAVVSESRRFSAMGVNDGGR